jgi:hypothetical protein
MCRPNGEAEARPVRRDRSLLRPAGARHPWPDEISTEWGRGSEIAARPWSGLGAPASGGTRAIPDRGARHLTTASYLDPGARPPEWVTPAVSGMTSWWHS